MLTQVEPILQEQVDSGTRWLVGFYGFVLVALFNLAQIGLISVPVSFFLEKKLHFDPVQLSRFNILVDLPYYVAFLFGFLRDRWRPFGKGDRGYFIAAPILMAIAYVLMARNYSDYMTLVIGSIAIAALSSLLGAAAQGLVSALGKDFGMTGRLGAIALICARGAMMYSTGLGGVLGQYTKPQVPFLLSGLVCLTVVLMAFWRPRQIFRSGDEVFVSVIPEGAWTATKRLLRHKAIYLPAIILFLWEFAPGWGTPLFVYLTDPKTINLDQGAYGGSQACLRATTVAAAILYTYLCTRVRFKPLLYWGTFLGVIGGPAFLLIHNAWQAYVVCALAGLSCGIALAAYWDLLVRCCPKELEGVAFMLSYALFTVAGDFSDLFGSWLYKRGGFPLALAISTAGTALIFIPVALLPRAVSDPREGDRIIDPDPPTAAPLPLQSS